MCSACNKRHSDVCRKLADAHAKNPPSPKAAAKQVQAPDRAKQPESSVLLTTSNITSAETANNEAPSCKHSRRDKECVSCECGCGKCHRPGKLCKKQLAESRKEASKKIEEQKRAAKQIKNQKKAAKQIKDQNCDRQRVGFDVLAVLCHLYWGGSSVDAFALACSRGRDRAALCERRRSGDQICRRDS